MTTFSQVVADRLGVGIDDVEILHGDTAVSALGMDTYGSRSLAVGGVAVWQAADKVIAKARRIAAHQLEVSDDDIAEAGGRFTVRGTDRSMTVAEAGFQAWTAHNLPDGMEPMLEETAVYDPPNFSWPGGCHVAVVEVDTETGDTRLVRYVAVDEVGTVVNPTIVDGQVHGGIAQGVGAALYEEAAYDDVGNLLNGSMVSYLVPSRGRAAIVRARPRRGTLPHEPDGRKGGRRDGHDRLDRRCDERRRRCVAAVRGRRRRHAGQPRARSPRDQGRCAVIPAPFDYEVAASVDDAIRLLGSVRGRQAAGRRALAAAAHASSVCPAGAARGHRPALRALVRAGRRRPDRGRRAHPPSRRGERATLLMSDCRIVAETARQIGDAQVRHRGTIGGSVAHGDPASDFPTVLLALEAELIVRGPSGERTVPAGEFFTGFLETALEGDEVLTEIRVPKLDGGCSYVKFNRRAQDWATVAVAAVRSNGGARVALGNMGAHTAPCHGRRRGARRRRQTPPRRQRGRRRARRRRATRTGAPSTAGTSRRF